MRKIVYLCLVIIILLIAAGCSHDSSGPNNDFFVTLKLLLNGSMLKTYYINENDDERIIDVNSEGSLMGSIKIEIHSLYEGMKDATDPIFLIIARKENHYSRVYALGNSEVVSVDYGYDFEEYPEDMNCGVIYDVTYGPATNREFEVYSDSVLFDTLITGDQGQFVTLMEAGDYLLDQPLYGLSFVLKSGYDEYEICDHAAADKPNIYIYPETDMLLDVDITLVGDGRIRNSIPQYPEKWKNLHVMPDGTIDGTYEYLFYETTQSSQCASFQHERGWVVLGENLSRFFENNLKETGFNEKEINDFLSYWIPLMNNADSYVIYPQYNEQLDQSIILHFSQQPDVIIRLIYLIEQNTSTDFTLDLPEIPHHRDGKFVVREWGVIPEFME